MPPQKTPFSRNSKHHQVPALLKYILVNFTALTRRGEQQNNERCRRSSPYGQRGLTLHSFATSALEDASPGTEDCCVPWGVC